MSDHREQIIAILQNIEISGGPLNMVQTGILRALSVKEGQVSFVLEAPEGMKLDMQVLKQAAQQAIQQIDWVTDVQVALSNPLPETAPTPTDTPPALPGVKHVIMIGSGKGGVGKSTVTANLALSMVEMGLRVGVLDADVHGPSQPRIMGTTGRPVSYEDTLIPIAVRGLKLMSLGLMTDADQALIWRGPILHDTLTRLLFEVRWAPLDVLLIDLPPGTGDVPLSIIQQVKIDGAVLVSTPQELSLLDLRRAMDLFRRTDTPMLGLIENMSTHICSQCGAEDHVFGTGLEDFAAAQDTAFLGKLPLNRAVCDAADTGTPLHENSDGADISGRFRSIAHQVLQPLGAVQ